MRLILKAFCASKRPLPTQLLEVLTLIQYELREVGPVGRINADVELAHSENNVSLCEIPRDRLLKLLSDDGGVSFAEKRNDGIEVDVGLPASEGMRYATATCQISMGIERLGWRESEAHFLALLENITKVFPPDLGFICTAGDSVHTYPAPLGIRAGLADLYWVTVFGHKYVELIQAAAFGACGGFENRDLEWGGRWVRMTERLSDTIDSEGAELKARMKHALGDDLFSRPMSTAPKHGGEHCFFDPRVWMRISREAKQREESKASRVPDYR
jgi:hypothetical protein